MQAAHIVERSVSPFMSNSRSAQRRRRDVSGPVQMAVNSEGALSRVCPEETTPPSPWRARCTLLGSVLFAQRAGSLRGIAVHYAYTPALWSEAGKKSARQDTPFERH